MPFRPVFNIRRPRLMMARAPVRTTLPNRIYTVLFRTELTYLFFSPPSLLLSVKSFTRKRITARHERTNGRTESKSGANQNDISAHTVHLNRGGCSSVVQLGRPINIRGGNFRVSFFFRSRKNRDRKRRFRRGKWKWVEEGIEKFRVSR